MTRKRKPHAAVLAKYAQLDMQRKAGKRPLQLPAADVVDVLSLDMLDTLQSKQRKRAKRAHKRKAANDNAQPAMLAWRCVVLAVDTARVSGYAIRAAGKLIESGQIDTLEPDACLDIICTAKAYAQARHLPVVLVLEKPWGGMISTLVALGMARERWIGPWRLLGLSKSHIVSVTPSSWRARVLGKGYGRATREEVREVEAAAARTLETRTSWESLGADECAAILISRWATYAPQVGAVLPKRVQEESRPSGQLTLAYSKGKP